MIGRDPPKDGILQKGVLYRFRVPRQPEREPDPEVLEIVRRVEKAQIQEYLEKKKRAS
jgi:hypothetical protein